MATIDAKIVDRLPIKYLGPDDWFLNGSKLVTVIGRCRAHPRSVQCIEFPGATIRCFLEDREVEQIEVVMYAVE